MVDSRIKRNITPFNGEKYSIWKKRIRGLLSELGVLKVINEETPAKITDAWKTAESTAKNILMEYLSDSFRSYVTNEKTVKDIFCDLDRVYEIKSIATQIAIRGQLFALKLEGDTKLSEHFLKFDALIEDLIAAGAKMEESDKIAHLLETIPKTYDGIKSALKIQPDTTLSLTFVKKQLHDQEIILLQESSDTSAKVLQFDNKAYDSKNGDDKTNDYKKKNKSGNNKNYKWRNNYHGQYRRRSFKQGRKFSNNKCRGCGTPGHFIRLSLG